MRAVVLALLISCAHATPKPAPSPLEAARAACRAGGCDALAEYWASRELVPASGDGRADAGLLAEACGRDDASACLAMALMFKYGTAGVRDDAGGAAWAR